ncbi:FixH family protein [Sutcliffiella halmapala]|uniref:FixH family protein n=1 Tax=Sutcliffiella halmapala TaxID=79882 RepID=UPI000994CD0A|nr:FixH family protein [Sutcliffiella halmapala]
MKKYTFLISIIITILILAACGNNSNKESTGNTDEVPTIIEVEVLLPESIEPNQEVKIEALVTQGGEKVADANEVTFEVWKQGQEADHEMIEGKNDGSGIYSFTKSFEEEGLYYVVAHTTAREMHVMPRVEVTVGNPDHHGHDSHNEDHDAHEHEHESTLMMTLNNKETKKVNQETTLTTEIKQENKPLTDALVSFEVWHEDSDKHEYIDAVEVSAGVYEAKTTFQTAGHHNIQIHVKKDKLHEHQLEVLEVE